MKGLIRGLKRADLRSKRGLSSLGGGTYGRTYGRLEIHPCVLQDIGPLGPLPKKCSMDNRGHVDLSHLRDLGWMHIPDRV